MRQRHTKLQISRGTADKIISSFYYISRGPFTRHLVNLFRLENLIIFVIYQWFCFLVYICLQTIPFRHWKLLKKAEADKLSTIQNRPFEAFCIFDFLYFLYFLYFQFYGVWLLEHQGASFPLQSGHTLLFHPFPEGFLSKTEIARGAPFRLDLLSEHHTALQPGSVSPWCGREKAISKVTQYCSLAWIRERLNSWSHSFETCACGVKYSKQSVGGLGSVSLGGHHFLLVLK